MSRLRTLLVFFLVFQFTPGSDHLVAELVHYVAHDHFTGETHHHHSDDPEGLTHSCVHHCNCAPSLFLLSDNHSDVPRSMGCTQPPHGVVCGELLDGYHAAPFKPPRRS